ncbi:MAG TPA: hypothetical protein VFE62_26305 [Gemmataceae bacterium]|nr:hypothetical protein [Gemmataceae bacterium]
MTALFRWLALLVLLVLILLAAERSHEAYMERMAAPTFKQVGSLVNEKP